MVFLITAALSHKYHSYLYLGNIDFMYFSILQQKIAALLHSIEIQYARP